MKPARQDPEQWLTNTIGIALLAYVIALAAAALTQAQEHTHEETPEVLAAEIYRRGNLVEDTERIYQTAEQWATMQVTQVPPDDSHKWFISVVTTQNCPACERLKADFIRSPYLSCWAQPQDRDQSWAHYNVYDGSDATQLSRWRKLKITAYPTIIIQPPRSGQFGPPSTVVFQRTGYNGDPQKLGADIRAALTKYAEKHYQPRYNTEADDEEPDELAEDPSGHAQAPPFPVPSPVSPLPSQIPPPSPHVNIPPPSPDHSPDPTEPGQAPVLPWIIAGVALAYALLPLARAIMQRARNAIVSDLAAALRPRSRARGKR